MFPGGWEWIVILVVLFIIFGAKRLPEIGRSLGQGIKSFRKEMKGGGDAGTTDKKESPDSSGKSDSSAS